MPTSLANGRYLLGDELGIGGVAKVVRAYDQHLKVDRAIKLIATDDQELRASLRRRLECEARTMAKVRHPHVLPVYDFGEQDGIYYVVTDVAENRSVMDRMQKGGAIRKDLAAGWMIQVLGALSVAHDQGIIHRDIKPHNLLLDDYDRILVVDFGIALVIDGERRTRAGVAMGSFAYMPPEQRLDASRVDATADIYAVGATLFHMLTGETPIDLFMADETRWRKVPPELREIIRRACQARPEDRYPSAKRMAEDLKRALATFGSRSTWLDRLAPFAGGTTRTSRGSGARVVTDPFPWTHYMIGVGLAVILLSGIASAYLLAR